MDERQRQQQELTGCEHHQLACSAGLFSPLDVAVALSLYQRNVTKDERAAKLQLHFNDGVDCTALVDEALCSLAPARQAVYVSHAIEMYGTEAKHRNLQNGMSR